MGEGFAPKHWEPLGDLITGRMHTAGSFVNGLLVRSGWETQPRHKLIMDTGSPFWKLHSPSRWGEFSSWAERLSLLCPLTWAPLPGSLPKLGQGQSLRPLWLLWPSFQAASRYWGLAGRL